MRGFGRSMGRVRVKRRTLRRPLRAKTTPEKAVQGKATVPPLNVIQRTIAIGRTSIVYISGYLFGGTFREACKT